MFMSSVHFSYYRFFSLYFGDSCFVYYLYFVFCSWNSPVSFISVIILLYMCTYHHHHHLVSCFKCCLTHIERFQIMRFLDSYCNVNTCCSLVHSYLLTVLCWDIYAFTHLNTEPYQQCLTMNALYLNVLFYFSRTFMFYSFGLTKQDILRRLIGHFSDWLLVAALKYCRITLSGRLMKWSPAYSGSLSTASVLHNKKKIKPLPPLV